MADFFTKEWADAVRDALTAGPDEQARAVKLQEYWDFFDWLKSVYPASWALGCRDLPGLGSTAYLFVQWSGGTVTDCRIIGPDDPLQATYVLAMDYRDWKALHDGYDAQRTVMYRKVLLEQGDLLGQRVRLPRAGADDPDDRLGVAVQRHLVAGGVNDPPGDPAGPLAGQVGHDRGHVVRGPLVHLRPRPAAVGRHRVGHPGGGTGRDRVHGDPVLAQCAG